MFSVRFIFILCVFAIFSSQNRPLSLSLIVGDTLCLGGSGFTGGKGQHQKHHHVGDDIVEVDGKTQLLEGANAVSVNVKGGVGSTDALEQSEQERA